MFDMDDFSEDFDAGDESEPEAPESSEHRIVLPMGRKLRLKITRIRRSG